MSNSSVKLIRMEPVFRTISATISVIPKRWQAELLELARPIPTRLGQAIRYVLLKNVAVSCGPAITILEDVYLKHAESLEMGQRVSVHPMCYIDATSGLRIGSDVSIAHGVTIMTTEHDMGHAAMPIREAPLVKAPVRIGNDVWIGAGVKILAGVEIGNRVVVGAGAVVTKNVPDGTVSVGVPARVVRYLVEDLVTYPSQSIQDES